MNKKLIIVNHPVSVQLSEHLNLKRYKKVEEFEFNKICFMIIQKCIKKFIFL